MQADRVRRVTLVPSARLAARALGVAGILALCWLVLRDRLAAIDPGALRDAVSATAPLALAAGFGLSALSHAALSCYDILAFRRIGRVVPLGRRLRGGFAGTVAAQTFGFGLLTGSFARHRIYRSNNVTPAEALALSAFVTAGFFSGLGVVLCVLVVLDPAPVEAVLAWAGEPARVLAGCALAGAFLVASAMGGRVVRTGGRALRLPSGKWLLAASLLAAADLVPAALCLYLLLPPEAAPPVAGFIAVYVTALALGHVIGAPGGVGPFESVLFLALPAVSATDLAAAILLYRALYHGPWAVLALGLMVTAPGRVPQQGRTRASGRIEWILDGGVRAEAELALLGDKQIFLPNGAGAFVMYATCGRFRIVMGEPHGPRDQWDAVMDAFEAEARRAGARTAIYKAEARALGFWRARGRTVQPLGEDAVLDPATFTLDTPDRRELRRKVAQVRKAGVEIRAHAPGAAPLDALAPVAEAWRAAKGGPEQTFSMGHWDPAFVSRHHVFEARLAEEPVAFLSVWVSGDGREWMIDLMRQTPAAPNGTMHALVVTALNAAQAARATRFNLCTAPLSGLERIAPVTWLSRLGHLAYLRLPQCRDVQGLRRFKETFRPEWEARLIVADNALGVVEALIAANILVRGGARGTGGLDRDWSVAEAGTADPARVAEAAARAA